MSKKFLEELNGAKQGHFSKRLKSLGDEPRIAWYPSAGEDFRDILYVSEKFQEYEPNEEDVRAPDIYLHTDYYPWESSRFLDSPILCRDFGSTLKVEVIEELSSCDLPLHDEQVDFLKKSTVYGKVIYMEISVQSDRLGDYRVPLIYMFVENAAFCAEKLLPSQAKLSHLIRIRDGGGFGGGGKTRLDWLYDVANQLGVEVIVCDDENLNNTETVRELYPQLFQNEDIFESTLVRSIDGERWSDYKDTVQWYVRNDLLKKP
jgi:hypothetical protein